MKLTILELEIQGSSTTTVKHNLGRREAHKVGSASSLQFAWVTINVRCGATLLFRIFFFQILLVQKALQYA